MLLKKNRVDTKTVAKAFKEGRIFNSPHLTLRLLKGGPERKVSFLAPKNIAKLAVKRNKLRRLGYNALREHIASFPLGTWVFMFKTYEDNKLVIENEIKNLLDKIN